jgi:hypothetical protein
MCLLLVAHSSLGQTTNSGAIVQIDDPVVAGKTYSEWLRGVSDWRRDPEKHASVADAIKTADKKGHSFLKACLSKQGFCFERPASLDVIEDWRMRAMYASSILGTQGAWLTEDLLGIVRERGWKGREIAVHALNYVSPGNAAAYSIAIEDLRSDIVDTRWQGVIQIRTMRDSPEALNRLIAAADDYFDKVRALAIYSLGESTNNPIVLRKLNEIKDDPKRTHEDRFRARCALDPNELRRGSGVISGDEIRRKLQEKEEK